MTTLWHPAIAINAFLQGFVFFEVVVFFKENQNRCTTSLFKVHGTGSDRLFSIFEKVHFIVHPYH